MFYQRVLFTFAMLGLLAWSTYDLVNGSLSIEKWYFVAFSALFTLFVFTPRGE